MAKLCSNENLSSEIYHYILEFVNSQPLPGEVLKFGPTDAMQERASTLLEKNRNGELSHAESNELDEFMRIDHLVTMLKAEALSHLP